MFNFSLVEFGSLYQLPGSMKVLKVTDDVHRDLRMVALSQDKTTAVLASQILRAGLDQIGVPQVAEPNEPAAPTHREPILDRVR